MLSLDALDLDIAGSPSQSPLGRSSATGIYLAGHVVGV